MQLKKNIIILIILLSLLSVCISCNSNESKKEKDKDEKKEKDKDNDKEKDKHDDRVTSYFSPPGYDLNKPVRIDLKTELDEISGLAYYPKDTSVFAITDEQGWLYKIHLSDMFPIEKWKFSKGQDFEDIVLIDSTFYVLVSKGELTAFKFLPDKRLITEEYKLKIGGKNEFEVLYHDPKSDKLVLVCKDCEGDSKKKVTAYSFDPGTKTFADTPFYTINADEIAQKLGEDKEKFKPSAAAIHPLTSELYVISSVNKVLVVAEVNGNIKNVYPLDPKIYKQPEGLTFSPAGDLIISNEGAEVGAANVLIFKRQSGGK